MAVGYVEAPEGWRRLGSRGWPRLITGTTATHGLTLLGIDAALAAGMDVTTNFVINSLNLLEPPEYVRGLRERWPQIVGRVFSFMAPVAAALAWP